MPSDCDDPQPVGDRPPTALAEKKLPGSTRRLARPRDRKSVAHVGDRLAVLAGPVPPRSDHISPERTYSSEEISAMIRSLTAHDKTALMKIAIKYAKKTNYGEEDLLQEACMRILAGRREWPRCVGVAPFLTGVMRSIAWEWQTNQQEECVDVDEIGFEDLTAPMRIDICKIVALFDDDPVAQKMLFALIDGVKGEELRKLSGLSRREYESKRTKIRRRLEKNWL
jgi:DNA-directed RNA polymerase specialized sigma24 family protein